MRGFSSAVPVLAALLKPSKGPVPRDIVVIICEVGTPLAMEEAAFIEMFEVEEAREEMELELMSALPATLPPPLA